MRNKKNVSYSRYFFERSQYELEDALKLVTYQNRRGGRVQLLPLQAPFSEFDNAEKGDALNAFELALGLEKIQNEKYLALQSVSHLPAFVICICECASSFKQGLVRSGNAGVEGRKAAAVHSNVEPLVLAERPDRQLNEM
jgi:hypothetical protein